MRVLVTGGSGFLGSHVVERLVGSGCEVVALVRPTSDRRHLEGLRGVRLAIGRIEDPKSLEAALGGVDGIIHAAGLIKARTVREFRAVNVDGTKALVDAAARLCPRLTRFVHVSSLAAVGPSMDGAPVGIDCTPRPVTAYGRSKLEAEQFVVAGSDRLPVTVIRPPMVYGPRDRETLAFFKAVRSGVLPLIGNGQNRVSVVYAADAADACIRALSTPGRSGARYFIDDGRTYRWNEMVAELEAVLGRRAWLRVRIPAAVLRTLAAGNELLGRITNRAVMLTRDKVNELVAPHWVCDSTDTRRDLGWSPTTDWATGIRLAAAWYRDAGWL